jgi:hypothetical protein
MAEVIVRRKVAAPAKRCWDLLADFGGLAELSPMIESCEVEGEGVGAVRTLHAAGGMKLQERLEAHDEAGLTFSYSIIGDNPLPLTDYYSTVTIEPVGDDACVIDWRGRFEPEGDDESGPAGIVNGIYTGGIAALGKKLGASVEEAD